MTTDTDMQLSLLRDTRRMVDAGEMTMICYALDEALKMQRYAVPVEEHDYWEAGRSTLGDAVADGLFEHDVDTVNELMHIIGVTPAEPYTSVDYERYTRDMAHLARLAWLDKLIEEREREQPEIGS